MPCDTRYYTEEDRRRAQEDLDEEIAAGRIKLLVDKIRGKIAIDGWRNPARAGWSDPCVLQTLRAHGKWATRQKINSAIQQLAPQQQEQYLHEHSH